MAFPLRMRDQEILACLRENGRQSLTVIGRKTKTPVSTAYDRLQVLEAEVIRKYSSLLDFLKLGYLAHAFLVIGTRTRAERDDLAESLKRQFCVNSVFRICSMSEQHLLVVEVVLPGLMDMEHFLDEVNSKYEIVEQQVLHVSEELMREGFLADRETAAFVPAGQHRLEEVTR
jgi:DNA-binding Lrp family transcriptional regulator